MTVNGCIYVSATFSSKLISLKLQDENGKSFYVYF